MDTSKNLDPLFRYVGKSIDNFEYVFNELFRKAGYKQQIAIDCLSLRCFAFNFAGDVSNWFCSSVNNLEAVHYLSSRMSSGTLKITREIEESSKYFVVLCNKNFFANETLRGTFYSSCNSVILCSVSEYDDRFFAVSDMLEHNQNLVKADEFLHFIKEHDFYIVSIENVPEFWAKPKNIIDEIRNIRMLNITRLQNVKFTRHEEISLRLGLMNYQIQMIKALNFLAQFVTYEHYDLYSGMRKILSSLLSCCDPYDSLKGVQRLEDTFTEIITSLP